MPDVGVRSSSIRPRQPPIAEHTALQLPDPLRNALSPGLLCAGTRPHKSERLSLDKARFGRKKKGKEVN